MEYTCFRCAISEEILSDNDYLFFDGYFLKDYNSNEENEKENNISSKFLDNNKDTFLNYLHQQGGNTKPNLQKVYNNVYISLHLCKLCRGLHNIDLILFYNKNSLFHHNVIKELTITGEEEKKINEVFSNMKIVLDTLRNNIDIIFFFFYLHEQENIKEESTVTLHTMQKIYEQINQYIIIKGEIENNSIKKKVNKIITFTLIYFYLTFYKNIYNSLNISRENLDFVVNIYKQSVLIFNHFFNGKEEIKNADNETESKNKEDKNDSYQKRRKINELISEGENRTFNGNEKDDNLDCAEYEVHKTEERASFNENVSNGERNYEVPSESIAIQENTLKGIESNELPSKNVASSFDVYVSFSNLCICGYYNKYNKEMCQTKWFLNGSSLHPLSVEECIQEMFTNVFQCSSCTFISSGREDKDVRMMNVGRPFVFVLKETKFSFLSFYLFFNKLKMVQIYESAHKNITEMKTVKEIIHFLQDYNEKKENPIIDKLDEEPKEENYAEQINNCYALINKKKILSLYDINSNKVVVENPRAKFFKEEKIGNLHITNNYNKELELLLSDEISDENSICCNGDNVENSDQDDALSTVNCDTTDDVDVPITRFQSDEDYSNINSLVDVKLNYIAFSTNYALIKKLMKYGEERKKAYKCLIYHSSPMTREKIQGINDNVLNYEKNDACVFTIKQKTPIRVLHRRGLIERPRKIYEFNLVFIHEHFSLLYLLTESGTYIKEFITGDRGRTFPNLKYFFGENAFVNILNLDVSSFVYNSD
ncbi:conserved Plasmodium protein, unknown function [Plasmodium ovale]|uniref:tRNA pseudouridine(55) synthase n=2 Tax=Plasmodium ovale TaxID=36330 RepID=A0A1A8X298_PLAOA|nr:conserved Plasmodium protein, unknown function [Plasmodium ovale curtisi]SBS97841.1 conserved Plasmodium protein, unknown function [Plasmodium ovale curtisi]SCP06387.1 conserved Plasmodium protein, unknown function [Plasmodium ovale]